MTLPKDVNDVLDKINKETSPVSIFVYGSQARGDHIPESDYDVGVLYEEKDKINRSSLSKMHDIKGLNIYPFVYENFTMDKLDTPFPTAFYLRSLIDGGAKTTHGEKVVEEIQPPPITVTDLLEEISFQIAYALGALLSFRQNDTVTAKNQLVGSIMHGSRVFLALNGEYVQRYDDILSHIKQSELDDKYKSLIEYAMKVRNNNDKINPEMIFTAISYLNQVVRHEVKKKLSYGNTVILDEE